jgi:predicted transcriptional regulator
MDFDFTENSPKEGKVETEMRRIRDLENLDIKYHNEMMRLIRNYNHVRNEYKNLANSYAELDAKCSVVVAVLRENLDQLAITKEEINTRIKEKIEALKVPSE